MNFIDFKNMSSKFIDEYIYEIEYIGKVSNIDTLKKRTDLLRCMWNTENETIRRQIIETLNEICFIHYLSVNYSGRITYEIITGHSGRSIDIELINDDIILLFDIKTIHPQKIDKWDAFKKAESNGFINGHISLSKNSLGGEFWHSMVSSRDKFVNYAFEYETKIREYTKKKKTIAVMLFCGNGYDWYEDELEDFVEWYKTGLFVESDHFRSMIKHSLKEKKIVFERTIDTFAILYRENIIKDYKIIHNVRMDKQFRRYIKE